MNTVISASRRTDIPAFYSDWFIERLREGSVTLKHPYTKEDIRVSLKPEDVSAFVFWSKNFSPLLSKLEHIEETSKNIFFHFTITGIRELEGNTPHPCDAISDLIYICRRYSKDHIIWRFDPVCATDRLPMELIRERFEKYSFLLKGHVARCYMSFMQYYRNTEFNLMTYSDHRPLHLSDKEKAAFAADCAKIAKKNGIKLYACCNPILVNGEVEEGSCINGVYLSTLFNIPLDTKRSPTRKGCRCTKSVDIGTYNTCRHGCLYCYAGNKALFNPDISRINLRLFTTR